MLKIIFIAASCWFLSACSDNENSSLNRLYEDSDVAADNLLKGADHIEFLYKQQRGGVQVSSVGRITKLLADQTTPYPAQLLLVRLSSGRKLLIEHDISHTTAVPNLTIGEVIIFSGTYKWNSKGGMVTSTYQQIDQPAQSGWLKYQDITYQ